VHSYINILTNYFPASIRPTTSITARFLNRSNSPKSSLGMFHV